MAALAMLAEKERQQGAAIRNAGGASLRGKFAAVEKEREIEGLPQRAKAKNVGRTFGPI